MTDTPSPTPRGQQSRPSREKRRAGPDRAASVADRTPTGRGTDKDLALKVAIRRLLWRMGCSTRLDVRLRAYVPARAGKAPAQDLTDLDVLGIGFTPAGQLHTTFADCRSTEGRALERMFWVRGVADFVNANDAFLVRAHDVPPAVRTLASRLAIGVLTPGDFAAMEATFPTELNLTDGPLGCLFNRDTAAAHLDAHNDADRKLRRLLDYLEFDYWIYDQHRNMTQLVAHLSDVVAVLDPSNRGHRTLFYDCVWHYALSAAHAAGFVRSTRMGSVPTAVETYVAGGELALREKAGLAKALESAGWPVSSSIVQPPYMQSMTELVNRYLIRPTETADVLRYAEYLAVSEVNRVEATVATAFGSQTRAIAAKLLADTCGFLVTAAGLRPDFRTHARERVVVDLTGGHAAAPADIAGGVSAASGATNDDSPPARRLPDVAPESDPAPGVNPTDTTATQAADDELPFTS